MKKFLVLLSVIVLTSACSNAACDNFNGTPKPKMTKEECVQREKMFEQRLGLTEEQKIQAKEVREKGFEKIKPVIDTLRAREREAEMVKLSKLAPEAQEEKLKSINSDISNLRKQAHEIKHENMKEFESILTQEQRKTLKEMKQEGREKYRSQHPPVRPIPQNIK